MKILGYVRVSTEEQAKEGISLQNQAERIKALCVAKGWELEDIISDEGFSGKSLKRPGVQRLIEKCRSRDVDVVAVYKVDRLTRRQRDLWNLLEGTFEKNGVGFISVCEPFDTTTAIGKACLGMIGVFAQLERDMIAERTRDALKFMRDHGCKTGGSIPFGFDLVEGGRLVKNKEEQGIIKLIKRLRGQGVSYRGVCADLEGKGIKAKKGGSKWNPKTIRKIAENF